MYQLFKILLIIFLVLFVISLLAALIQGIRIKNQASKKWGIAALGLAILAVGSFWGVSASKAPKQSNNEATTNSNNQPATSSISESNASSNKTSSQTASEKASSESQKKQDQHEQAFEERDRRRQDMDNKREANKLAKRGTDKKGYQQQISGVPEQSSHVVEKVVYDGNRTTVKISTDLTMGNRRENEHNAFTVWSGIKRIAYLHHVKTDVIIQNHNGKEIANTNGNRFNYLE